MLPQSASTSATRTSSTCTSVDRGSCSSTTEQEARNERRCLKQQEWSRVAMSYSAPIREMQKISCTFSSSWSAKQSSHGRALAITELAGALPSCSHHYISLHQISPFPTRRALPTIMAEVRDAALPPHRLERHADGSSPADLPLPRQSGDEVQGATRICSLRLCQGGRGVLHWNGRRRRRVVERPQQRRLGGRVP